MIPTVQVSLPTIQWAGAHTTEVAFWRSESGMLAPETLRTASDRDPENDLFRWLSSGQAVLWLGDYPRARQLLQNFSRRYDQAHRHVRLRLAALSGAALFAAHREEQRARAQFLARLLVPLSVNYRLPLRRAQAVSEACLAAWGPASGPTVLSLRELLGVVSAYEWQKKGISIPALGGRRVFPCYGVFSPLRGEYLDLVAKAPLPPVCAQSNWSALDIGTGSGVLAAVLASRGAHRVTATDQDPRALACAARNLEHLGYAAHVSIQSADLYPGQGRGELIVCNPPWIPAIPSAPVEYAVFDPDSRMLRGFLAGASRHLMPNGEAWLILSDIAERLGLRTRAMLLSWIAEAGLQVADRLDTLPAHKKASDTQDPLFSARSGEVTSLWRLVSSP